MMKRVIIFTVAILGIILVSAYIYKLPPVYDRLGWRVESLKADVIYALNPPEQVIFVPKSSGKMTTPSPSVLTVTRTPTPTISLTRVEATDTPIPSATITPTPTSIPAHALLNGFTHAYQMWNNCGPANLATGLSYWGWEGDQRDTAAYLKPNDRDKNVMPYEMEAFVKEETDLSVIVRVGGDLDLLKAFISAGIPVIVEKGFEGTEFDGWMGHYEVINGYDDAKKEFYVQDSYKGPDYAVSYEDMQEQWRAFNFLYIIPYSLKSEAQVMDILDLQANAHFNYRHAAQIAAEETETLSGRDLFFAFYNLGSSLIFLNDYGAAAVAYDAAFANYPSIPEKERPWRLLWYSTGPYFAYYYTGRYDDVIELATTTLQVMAEPILEESYYWRAKAKLALSDNDGAIEDFKKSLEVHPDFGPSVDELLRLGIEP
jgi:hypothetical protein